MIKYPNIIPMPVAATVVITIRLSNAVDIIDHWSGAHQPTM